MGPQTLTFLSIFFFFWYEFFYIFFQDAKKAADFHANMQWRNCRNYQTALSKPTFCYFSYVVQYSNHLLQQAVFIPSVKKIMFLSKKVAYFSEGGFLSDI